MSKQMSRSPVGEMSISTPRWSALDLVTSAQAASVRGASAPWVLGAEPISGGAMLEAPGMLADFGVDVIYDNSAPDVADDPSTMGSNPPEAESESEHPLHIIAFRRPTSTEVDAGYTDSDYVVMAPSAIESPFKHQAALSRSLFGTQTDEQLPREAASGRVGDNIPYYGDAASVINDIANGAVIGTAKVADWATSLNVSPTVKRLLGAGALLWAGKKVLPMATRLWETHVLKQAIDGRGADGESTFASPASEMIVKDAVWHGARGNTRSGEEDAVVYDIPNDFWRTMYALGDVYEHEASTPGFISLGGYLSGDPLGSDGDAATALLGVRVPDVFLQADGSMVHSPIPYAADVFAGGLFSKVKNAVKKVASKAVGAASKVLNSSIVQKAAAAVGYGGVAKAAAKVAKVADKLVNSSKDGDKKSEEEPKIKEGDAVDSPVTPSQDTSGSADPVAPAESSQGPASVMEIQNAVAQAGRDDVPGAWRDYLDNPDVSPNAVVSALTSDGSPVVGDPSDYSKYAMAPLTDKPMANYGAFPGVGIGRGKLGTWLLKVIADMAVWAGVDHVFSKAESTGVPGLDSKTAAAPMSGQSAKTGFAIGAASLPAFLQKIGGGCWRFCKSHPKLAGALALAGGAYAYTWWDRRDRKRSFDAIMATLMDMASSADAAHKQEFYNLTSWMTSHKSSLINSDKPALSEQEMSTFECILMLVATYLRSQKEEGASMTKDMEWLLARLESEKVNVSMTNPEYAAEVAASVGATIETSPSISDDVSDEELELATRNAQSKGASRPRLAEPDPEDPQAIDDMISTIPDDVLKTALQSALAGVDASLTDEQNVANAKKVVTESLVADGVPEAVALSVVGSLLAMMIANGVMKLKRGGSSGTEAVVSFWRSSSGANDSAVPARMTGFPV